MMELLLVILILLLLMQDNTLWTTGNVSNFASSSGTHEYNSFSGSLQEIRYYNTQISESVFKDYVMNPLSFEGNGVNSAPDQLIFRAALGSELDITTTSSIHPICNWIVDYYFIFC